MDPVTAVGLASAIVQFIEVGSSILSKSIEAYKSAEGTTRHDYDIAHVITKFQDLNTTLKQGITYMSTAAGALSSSQRAVRDLADECSTLSAELLATLQSIQVTSANRVVRSVGTALKSLWKKEKVDSMKAKLDDIKDQLQFSVLVDLSSEIRGLGVVQSTRFNDLDHQTQLLMDALVQGSKQFLRTLESHRILDHAYLEAQFQDTQSTTINEGEKTRSIFIDEIQRTRHDLDLSIRQISSVTSAASPNFDITCKREGWVQSPRGNLHYPSTDASRLEIIPLESVESYTDRLELSAELETKLHTVHSNNDPPHTLAVYGLGGSGKTQLVLKYIEEHRERYNAIFWINAEDQQTAFNSFKRIAEEIPLPKTHEQESAIAKIWESEVVRGVFRWLREMPWGRWLIVIDNADELSWGVRNLVPKGKSGTVIITSRHEKASELFNRKSEKLCVYKMTAEEGLSLLIKDCITLSSEEEKAAKGIIQVLDCLALAIDLARASLDYTKYPQRALRQYFKQISAHKDEVLKDTTLEGLRSYEKTIKTVWDVSFEAVRKTNETAAKLLIFLSFLNASVIQDELFRLASAGLFRISQNQKESQNKNILPGWIGNLTFYDNGWDNFEFEKSISVLRSHSLIQPARGEWPGASMHSLVQWRAKSDAAEDNQADWSFSLVYFLAAAAIQSLHELPDFRRHIVVHLREIKTHILYEGGPEAHIVSNNVWAIARVFSDEGFWEEAEQIQVQVMETSKTKFGLDNPTTLASMANLASTYMNQGRWDEAEKLELEVMETRKIRLGLDHHNTLTSMSNLALTYRHQGRWDEAEKLEVEVVEICKMKFGLDNPDTLTSMANLASTYRNQGQWTEAEKLEVEVMKTRKIKLGPDHPDTLTSMANLASTYMNQGRWDEAEKLEVEVMKTRKIKLGLDHPDTLTSMANLALTHSKQGRWDEAEKLEVEATETSKTRLGLDHPDTLISMANLASTYMNQGRWDEAEKLQVKVMETNKNRLGLDHPDTLSNINNLAATYSNQGRWEKAENLQVEVMETSKTKLGPDHPTTLSSMNNLAISFSNQSRWDEAEKLKVEVMETRKIKLGLDHPDTLISMANLASTYWSQSRWDEAEMLDVKVMEICKTKLGIDHPNTLTIMANLASTYRSQSRWDDAEKLEVEVMETRKTKLGIDHPHTLTTMANLALTYWNQSRWDEAEKLEVEVIKTRKIKLGLDHPDTLLSMNTLAVMYNKQGRWSEAEKLEVEVMETSKTKLGLDHPDTLASMAKLGSTYNKQGRWSEAEKLQVEVMETSETKLGPDHPDTLMSMANLASTYWYQGRWDEAEELEVEVMEARKTKLGVNHPDTLLSMVNLAFTLKSLDRKEEATQLLRDAGDRAGLTFGYEDSRTCQYVSILEDWSMEGTADSL